MAIMVISILHKYDSETYNSPCFHSLRKFQFYISTIQRRDDTIYKTVDRISILHKYDSENLTNFTTLW